MSASTVVTRGFGSFGNINLLPTRGYGSFGTQIDLTDIPECRTVFVKTLNNTVKVPC